MASWDDPTGEHPVVQTGPIEQVPPDARSRGRTRSSVDRALTTAFIGVLVIAVAVGAFIYGRSRVDNSVSTTPAVSSTAPIVLPESTTTSTTVRRGASTTTTEPAPSDTIPVATLPSAPVTTAPRTPPTTATTVPPTTATTAPAATGTGTAPTNP